MVRMRDGMARKGDTTRVKMVRMRDKMARMVGMKAS